MDTIIAIIVTVLMAIGLSILMTLSAHKKEIWDEIYKRYFGGKR